MGQALQVPATIFCFSGGRRTFLFLLVQAWTLRIKRGSLPSKPGSYKRWCWKQDLETFEFPVRMCGGGYACE